VTATSESGLELALVHLGSALDAKPLGLAVELFLGPLSRGHEPTSLPFMEVTWVPQPSLTNLRRRKRRNRNETAKRPRRSRAARRSVRRGPPPSGWAPRPRREAPRP